MMARVKSCTLHLSCNEDSNQSDIRSLGFDISIEDDCLSCNLTNPSRDKINRFLDLVEKSRMVEQRRVPEESEDYEIIPSPDRMVSESEKIKKDGGQRDKNICQQFGKRDAEEGTEYPMKMKGHQSPQGICGEELRIENDRFRDQSNQIDSTTHRELKETDRSQWSPLQNDFGQGNELKNYENLKEKEEMGNTQIKDIDIDSNVKCQSSVKVRSDSPGMDVMNHCQKSGNAADDSSEEDFYFQQKKNSKVNKSKKDEMEFGQQQIVAGREEKETVGRPSNCGSSDISVNNNNEQMDNKSLMVEDIRDSLTNENGTTDTMDDNDDKRSVDGREHDNTEQVPDVQSKRNNEKSTEMVNSQEQICRYSNNKVQGPSNNESSNVQKHPELDNDTNIQGTERPSKLPSRKNTRTHKNVQQGLSETRQQVNTDNGNELVTGDEIVEDEHNSINYDLSLSKSQEKEGERKRVEDEDQNQHEERNENYIDNNGIGNNVDDVLEDGDDLDNEEEIGEVIHSVLFKRGQYELALNFFADSDIIDYIKKPEWYSTSAKVELKDKDCHTEVVNFIGNLKQQIVSNDRYHQIEDIRKHYNSKIFVEYCDGNFLLTYTMDIHDEIENMLRNANEDSKSNKRLEKGQAALSHEKSRQESLTSDGIFKDENANLIVKVLQEDITRVKVDVIVNAANARLNFNYGLAKVIAYAAGSEMVCECMEFTQKNIVDVTNHFISSAGKLQAKQVYHAVGPNMKNYSGMLDECKQHLRQTIFRCLVHAERDGHHSIVFPSISSAMFKVPREICAESYMKAVHHFKTMRKKIKSQTLNKVFFVDVNNDMVEVIKTHFEQNWDIVIDTRDPQFQIDKRIMDEYFVPSKGRSNVTSIQQRSSDHPGSKTIGSQSASSQSDYSQSNSVGVGAKLKFGKNIGNQGELCQICSETRRMVKLPCCKQLVCENCKPKLQQCPFCPKIFGILIGDQPDGFMTVRKDTAHDIPSYGKGLYEILYYFYEKGQKPYRVAYIPATKEGIHAVRHLMLAFIRRQTFTRGFSLTRGIDNQIVWNGIHHKTSLKENDQFGYPDETYFVRLKSEFQSKGVTMISMNDKERTNLKQYEKELKNSHFCHVFHL